MAGKFYICDNWRILMSSLTLILAGYLAYIGKCIKWAMPPMSCYEFTRSRIKWATSGNMWHKRQNRRPATTGRYFKYSHGHDYSPPRLLVTRCNQFTQYQYLHRETGEYLRFVDIHPWPAHRLADLVPDSLWAGKMLDKLVQLNC